LAKKKAFICFDFYNDISLKNLIIGQAKNTEAPFEVSDFSLKEAAPEREWLDRAKRAISRSDVFIVMLGPKTNKAPGVLKEVKIANEFGTKKFQIIGYKEGSETWRVPDAGRVYSWKWENLKKLFG